MDIFNAYYRLAIRTSPITGVVIVILGMSVDLCVLLIGCDLVWHFHLLAENQNANAAKKNDAVFQLKTLENVTQC